MDELVGAEAVGPGEEADENVAEPPLREAKALPLEPAERVAGRVRLRDNVARELPPPVVVVALSARVVELALAPMERRAAGVEEGVCARADGDVDRQAAGLDRHERGEREQLS